MGKLRSFIVFFGFSLFVGMIIYSNLTRPRVLIIQSYNTDYSWTRDVDTGLKNIFSNYKNYQIMWHYMDTKNHPEESHLKNMGLITRNLVNSIQPSILIMVDDDAQNYVGRFYVNHPTIKLVYAGVNGLPETYGYDKASNATGILERIPLEGLRDVLMEVARLRNLTPPIRIAHISDGSDTVRNDDNYLHARKAELWYPIQVMPSYLVNTFDEWRRAVADAQTKAHFVIVSNYRRIYVKSGSPEKVPPPSVLQWTVQNSKIPVIGVNAFVTEDGGGLSVATSPIEQGEVAASQAVEILKNGKQPKDIPIQATKQFVICIRETVLKKICDLSAVYGNFARYAKKFWE